MKLIFAIVSSDDSSNVITELVKNRYSATKLATTGGFLRAGNVTIIIGCDDDKVARAIEIIGEQGKSRTEVVSSVSELYMEGFIGQEVKVGGATVFVVNVEEFYKL